MAYHKLTRFIITLNVSLLNLFFKVKDAKVNRVFRRVARGAGDEDVVVATKPSNNIALEVSSDAKSDTTTSKGPMGALKLRLDISSSFSLVEDRACSNLPKLDRFLKLYYRVSELYYWYLLIKNVILCLLRHETFASWRFLDCYLLGRFIINGRVIELSSYCACYVAIIRLIWVYTIAGRLPEYKMPCIEFLLDERGHTTYWSRGAETKIGTGCHMYHSTLLEYRDPFHRMHSTDATAADPLRLRPNRTREVWNALARTAIIFEAVTLIIFILLGIWFLGMGLPVVFTRRGVEYNYRHCLHWLAQERARGSKSWLTDRLHELFLSDSTGPVRAIETATATEKYVRPPIIQDIYLPYTGLVDLSTFHVIRSTLEVFETAVLYLEIGFLLDAACFMTTIFSKDILHYCYSINKRLDRHIRTRQAMAATTTTVTTTSSNEEATTMNLGAGTSDIQAQVADLLIMLDSYNRYMSRQSACLLIYWFGYSGLVSSWIFTPGNESPKLEWYVIHCGTTLYVFILLIHMSEVRTSCRRMYRLVSVAMGLDEDHKARKSIWLSLLNFYKPKPLYCFTMIGSIEITYMLGLKLLVWLLSALIIASSFFQVYNIK